MKSAYRVIAILIALGVVFQAAVVAFGVFESIDSGIAIRGGPDQPNVGPVLHFVGGMIVIPVLTLLLLICSFFAKVQGGVRWALFVLLAVFTQVMLGGFAFELPALGLLHGGNAFVILTLALVAARAAGRVEPTTAAASAKETAAASP